jgi:hypothetical protein
MLLLHARVHVARHRELIAMQPHAHEEPPEPVTVECPRPSQKTTRLTYRSPMKPPEVVGNLGGRCVHLLAVVFCRN